MQIIVKARSGKIILDNLKVKSEDAKVDEVMKAITAKLNLGADRQRLTYGTHRVNAGEKQVPLEHGKLLNFYGITNNSVLVFKDLGPQVGWKTVFLIEYFGPIFIHAFFYFFPKITYGNAVAHHSSAQTIGMAMILIHFLKRELETMFVHRFSNSTMPIRNLPKNCAHYWLFGGLMIAYP